MAQVFKNAMFADPPYSYLCFSDCANCVISLRSWVHHRKTPRKIPEDSGQEGILSGSWHDSSCTSSVAESCHEACPVQTFFANLCARKKNELFVADNVGTQCYSRFCFWRILTDVFQAPVSEDQSCGAHISFGLCVGK